eukprot:g73410.t1
MLHCIHSWNMTLNCSTSCLPSAIFLPDFLTANSREDVTEPNCQMFHPLVLYPAGPTKVKVELQSGLLVLWLQVLRFLPSSLVFLLSIFMLR